MADKLEVIERGSDMVLAAHRTPVRRGLVATTLETVRFQRPNRVDFRLVRGPVPHVVEHFLLHQRDGGTTIEYGGELGADLWAVGRWWGRTGGAEVGSGGPVFVHEDPEGSGTPHRDTRSGVS
jgi:hypothetical protein